LAGILPTEPILWLRFDQVLTAAVEFEVRNSEFGIIAVKGPGTIKLSRCSLFRLSLPVMRWMPFGAGLTWPG